MRLAPLLVNNRRQARLLVEAAVVAGVEAAEVGQQHRQPVPRQHLRQLEHLPQAALLISPHSQRNSAEQAVAAQSSRFSAATHVKARQESIV